MTRRSVSFQGDLPFQQHLRPRTEVDRRGSSANRPGHETRREPGVPDRERRLQHLQRIGQRELGSANEQLLERSAQPGKRSSRLHQPELQNLKVVTNRSTSGC